jgi:uncharacterized protein DUF2017
VGSIRRHGRRVRVVLDADEKALALSLISVVDELLSDGVAAPTASDPPDDETQALEELLSSPSGPVEPPRDPALLRLLPDGYRNDDDAAGEFRRLTESGLRAIKRAALQRVVDDLSADAAQQKDGGVRVDLDEAAAEAWLPAITDLRLVFGTRIGVTEDMDDERETVPEGSRRFAELVVYDWLSSMQEAIVHALVGD